MTYLFVGHASMKRHAVLRHRAALGLEMVTMDECAEACERLRDGSPHRLFLVADEACEADADLAMSFATAS
jgi:hypothetical protein